MSAAPDPLDGWTSDARSWHFQRRLWTRSRIRLEFGEHDRILRLIARGQAPRLPSTCLTPRRGVYVVNLRGKPVFIVAEPDVLVTALPPNAFEHYQGRWQVARGKFEWGAHQAMRRAAVGQFTLTTTGGAHG